MKRFCLALNLKDDPLLIEKYISHHKNVWPEILESIRVSGIIMMEIYQVHTRLFMIMEVNDDFSFTKKNQADQLNPKVGEWEELLDTYQQRLPFAKGNEKWVLMDKIFEL
jgi:L-rhamnose mutarotase